MSVPLSSNKSELAGVCHELRSKVLDLSELHNELANKTKMLNNAVEFYMAFRELMFPDSTRRVKHLKHVLGK